MTGPSRLHQAALGYARMGWRVFPLLPRDKKPATAHGVKDATTDLPKITTWWDRNPDYNIGIACGEGILVVDVDVKDPAADGEAAFRALIEKHGDLPETPRQITGQYGDRRGFQLAFRADGETRNTSGKLGPGIDTRGDGGYIVAAPSIHPTGVAYAWTVRPSQTPLAPAPAWLVELIARPKISEMAAARPRPTLEDIPETYARAALDREYEAVASAPKGRRNATLNTAAFNLGTIVQAGVLAESLVVQTLEAAADACGYTGEEGAPHVLSVIRSGLAAGLKAQPRDLKKNGDDKPPPARPANGTQAKPQLRVVHPEKPAEDEKPEDHKPDAAPAFEAEDHKWLIDDWRDLVVWKDSESYVLASKCRQNAHMMLLHRSDLRGLIAYDQFRQTPVLMRRPPWPSTGDYPRAVQDPDISGLAAHLERSGLRLGLRDVSAALEWAAYQNQFHPVRDPLMALQWDGVERLDHWLVDFLGAEDTSFTRQAGSNWLIAAVARVLRPGCKVDTMLVLEGAQGKGKSTAFAVLADALAPNVFTDRLSNLGNKDAAQELQGNLIVEIAELDALRRTDVATVKAFLSRAVDKVRLPYGRYIVTMPRSCVFAGTVNPGGTGWQHDPTGGRRFWPIAVTDIDLAGLRKAAPQLWAEARTRFDRGESWWIEDEVVLAAARLAAAERHEEDPWGPYIDDFVGSRRRVATAEILEKLGVPKEKITAEMQRRVASHLTFRGFERKKAQDPADLKVRWMFCLPDTLPVQQENLDFGGEQ